MAIIVPSALAAYTTPVSTDILIVEGASVGKSTIAQVVTAGRPFANQSQAEIGTGTTQTMNPLTVKQSIASEVGDSVQAHNNKLDAIAGLTGAANKIPYFTGASTAALLSFLDEDDFASNSATAVPSQQSVKAYVDAHRAADRTALAAVNTNAHQTVYLTEDGREGVFRRVTAVSVAGWAAIDTTNAIIVPSSFDATYSWLRVDYVRTDVRWCGAVNDGTVDIDDDTNIYTPTGTGAVTGTDNLAAFQAAQVLYEATGRPVFVPQGIWRCAIPNTSQANIIEYTDKFHWFTDAPGDCWIIMDDDPTYNAVGQTGNTFFGGVNLYDSATYDQGLHQHFIMRGIGLRGTWWRDVEQGAKTWTSANNYRVHAIGPTNTSYVLIQDCRFRDIVGFLSRARSCQKVDFINNDSRRVCGDGLRAEDCSNVLWQGNFILHNDDDSITNPDHDDKPNDLGPRRMTAIMVNNRIIASQPPLILGAAHTVIANNALARTYGSGLSVLVMNADATDRGEGGIRTCLIQGNVIEDHLKAHPNADPPNNTWGGTVNAVAISGAAGAAVSTTDPLGDGSSDPVANMPWSAVDYPWGGMHLQDQVGSDAKPDESSGYRGSGLLIDLGVVRRTLPTATNYSDWGYGKRFTRYGFDDPAVTDAEFALHLVQFAGSFEGIEVRVGVLSGAVSGSAIRLTNTATDHFYRNFVLRGGVISNCRNPISADAASTRYQDITVDGTIIDGDPFRIQAERAAGNKWSSTAATAPTGVQFTFLRGCTLRNITFKNVANMWTLEGGAIENPSYNTVEGCLGIVDFGAAGTSTTHTDNRGIGRIPVASHQISYQVRDLDPTSGTFRQAREGMRKTGGARPTTGYYVRGHIHQSGDILDIRKTTGSAHVAGTDWAAV